MATNSREVELALKVSTSNTEAVKNLRDDISRLAKSSSDAAPEFQRLVSELDKLAQESQNLQKLGALGAQVDQLAAAQATAADRARQLTAAYNDLSAKTDEASAAQRKAQTEYDNAKNSVARLAGDLRQLKADYQGAARESQDYQDKLKNLVSQENLAREAMRDKKTALDAAKQATSEARKEQNALSNDYRNAVAQAGSLSGKLAEQKQAYDELSRATTGTSGSMTDLIAANSRVAQSMAAVKAEVDAVAQREQEAALAARALANANEDAAARAKADAAAYAQWWTNAMDKQEAAMQKANASIRAQVNEAKAASTALQTAFGTVGAQSVEQLEAKIKQTRDAMELLKKSGALLGPELKVATKQGEQAIADLERQIRAARGELTLADKASNLWNQSMGGMKVGTLLAAGAISAVFQKVTETGRAFIEAIATNERYIQSLNAIYKSGQTAASQMDFLRTSANNAGVKVTDISQEFIKFSAAMNGANIPLETSNRLFAAVTKASGALGMSSADTSRALSALGQIASKGVVSMEELRQQLGDAMPGALTIASDALGLTEAQLIKLVSSGQLASEQFLPAFAAALEQVQGKNESLENSFNRLLNSINAFFVAVGDSGALDLLKGGLNFVSTAANGMMLVLGTASEALFLFTKAAGGAAFALINGDGLKGAMAEVSRVGQDAADRILLLADRLLGTQLAAQNASPAVAEAAAKKAELAAAAESANKALIQLNNAVSNEAIVLAQATGVAETNAKTIDTLTDAQIKVAKSIGDVNLQVETQISAYQRKVEATQAVFDAATKELDLLKAQFEATVTLMNADGLLDDKEQERIRTMALAIEKQVAVVDGIKAKISAQNDDLAQAELTKQMIGDQSAMLEYLKKVYDDATEAVNALRAAKAAGADVDSQLTEMIKFQTAASMRLTDAQKDLTENLKAKNITTKAASDLEQAGYQLQLKQYDSLLALGKATGDVNLQRMATIGHLRTEIAMSEAKAKAMVVEADGIIAVAKAEMARLASLGQLTELQRAQLQATISNAEAKKLEAAAMIEGNKQLSAQLVALMQGKGALDAHANSSKNAAAAQDQFGRNTSEATAKLEAQNSALERNIAAQEKALDLAERADALERRRKNVDKDGFTLDSNGNRMQAAGAATRAQTYNEAISAGLSKESALAVANAVASMSNNGQGGVSQSTMYKMINDRKLQDAERDVTASKAAANNTSPNNFRGEAPALPDAATEIQRNTVPTTTRAQPTALPRTTSAGASGTAKTYNVTLGNSTVRTVSDQDAQSLVSMLSKAKASA